MLINNMASFILYIILYVSTKSKDCKYDSFSTTVPDRTHL